MTVTAADVVARRQAINSLRSSVDGVVSTYQGIEKDAPGYLATVFTPAQITAITTGIQTIRDICNTEKAALQTILGNTPIA